MRPGFPKAVAALLVLALTSPATADPRTARETPWSLHAAPATAPHRTVAPGRQALPGIAWADVYIPESYDLAKPAPLALLLHGSGDRGRTMIDAFSDEAERHGAILLAVDSEAYSWDLMVEGARLKNTTRVPLPGEDVTRIDQALARAFDLYAIDPKRVALVGFSDGAGYGLSLGANNADLFGTVIAFSPGLLARIDGRERGRVFIAHGLQDRTLPVGPSRDIFAPALRNLGFSVNLRLFEGRHEMPANLRAEAFNWWLGAAPPADPVLSAQ